MNKVAKDLTRIFSGYRFTLLVFNSGKGQRMNYISSAERPGMLASMREFIGIHEGTDPLEQVKATLPLALDGLTPGTEVAFKFKVPEKGDHIERIEILQWNEGAEDVRV